MSFLTPDSFEDMAEDMVRVEQVVRQEPVKIPTEDEVRSGAAVYPTFGRTTVYDRQYKSKGKLYILDNPKGHSASSQSIGQDLMLGDSILRPSLGPDLAQEAVLADVEYDSEEELDSDPHKAKCDMVRKFFSRNSVYTAVRMKPLVDAASWDTFWDETLQASKEDELIIIYFHGTAGGNGPDWRWKMRGGPNVEPYEIDAYRFINKLCKDSKADVLILAECYYATRMQKRGELITQLAKRKHTVELVCSGQVGQDTMGTFGHSNFIDKILQTLRRVLKGEFKVPRFCPIPSFSLSQMVMGEPTWDSNPYRSQLAPIDRPNKDKKVWRLRLDPIYVAGEKKLVFHRDCIMDVELLKRLDEARIGDPVEQAQVTALLQQIAATEVEDVVMADEDEGYDGGSDKEDGSEMDEI